MARRGNDRASMREGPLAALFRKTVLKSSGSSPLIPRFKLKRT